MIEFLGRDYLGTYTGWRVNPISLTFWVNVGFSLDDFFVFEIGRQENKCIIKELYRFPYLCFGIRNGGAIMVGVKGARKNY